ncbi:copper amine oxidase [Ascobolus immersus RN42]|uniref:Amine oxidase n=1 Tax=Ascobolus immersus RN42 TaxID=1160509 RepID=A0A3N4J1W1_ASCIM|nr:copper amine oxidase [Ascobolus immersus RN42]
MNPRHVAAQKRANIHKILDRRETSTPEDPLCSDKTERLIKAPKHNVWDSLTVDEVVTVTGYMFTDSGYNLTKTEEAGNWDNTIALVELFLPNKTDALAYIDGKTDKLPERYAHVIVDMRATEEPYMQDLLVGPLPVDNATTTVQPLDWAFNKGSAKARNYNADEDARYAFMLEVTKSITDITEELWNITVTGEDTDGGSVWGIDPLWREEGRTIAWDQLWLSPTSEFDTGTILPSGFYIKSDITGRDPSKWKILGLLHDGIYYDTVEDFRKAFEAGKVKALPVNEDGPWGWSDPDGEGLLNDDLHPPVQIAPSGARYQLDKEEKYVEWMGFSFYIGFSRDTGMRLFDIRYKGERIIYELGLQEALAHYAGNDPTQSGTAYLDTFYGFGPWAFELLKGYDCPTYATYLNSTYFKEETHATHINSLCLFEHDAGYPLARHTKSTMATSTKNIYLVLRSISTVGNYDYMFDYHFHLDGSMSVEVRASGYIQSAFFAHNQEYGYQIHDALSGSMHDHVLNYKVDFDIAGTENSVRTTEFIPTTEKYHWNQGKPRNTMKLKRGWVDNEDQGSINWHPNGAMSYAVVNKNEKNKFGEYRGYKLHPATGVIHATVEDSSNLLKSAEWAKHHLYITKHKESERSSAHPYNPIDTEEPVVDFSKFLDGESLDQEDIVMWFNLGMHHAPTTQDLPNTVFTTAHSAMNIEPVNFFYGSPHKNTKHQIRVNYDNGNVNDISFFGTEAPKCPVDLTKTRGEFSEYKGDIVVRKFPYDPRNWYYQTHTLG